MVEQYDPRVTRHIVAGLLFLSVTCQGEPHSSEFVQGLARCAAVTDSMQRLVGCDELAAATRNAAVELAGNTRAARTHGGMCLPRGELN